MTAKSQLLGRGLTPKKSFGQNFMIDQSVNEVFAGCVKLFGPGLPIVEIGAGTGSLTEHLVNLAPIVYAVERDRDLLPILSERFAHEIGQKKLILCETNGAKFDLSQVFAPEKPGVLVGNLPYHLTSSIIFLALRNAKLLHGAVFMVQKEVADRLCAQHNSKQYGFLTAVINLAFTVTMVKKIDRTCFWPAPKIDSAIISLVRKDSGLEQLHDIEKFIVFVREIFQKRRKKLSTILGKNIHKEVFDSLAIDPNLRPENLEPKQFLQLFLRCHHA